MPKRHGQPSKAIEKNNWPINYCPPTQLHTAVRMHGIHIILYLARLIVCAFAICILLTCIFYTFHSIFADWLCVDVGFGVQGQSCYFSYDFCMVVVVDVNVVWEGNRLAQFIVCMYHVCIVNGEIATGTLAHRLGF